MNYSRGKIEPTSFADDVEKMRDFILLSKEEFLRSYSYLTEEEYDLTAADILQQAASLKTLPSVGEAEKQFYRVAITETYVREVNIYAEDSAAAEELADELCSEDKIAIDYDHFAHRKAECQGISRTSDLELLECYGATGIAALGKGDRDSEVIRWFEGTLDENFYYCERNEELFVKKIQEGLSRLKPSLSVQIQAAENKKDSAPTTEQGHSKPRERD